MQNVEKETNRFYIWEVLVMHSLLKRRGENKIGLLTFGQSTNCKCFFIEVFHEDGIITGYRHPRSSATDCILSLFQMTNETLNIWTHFLPTWYSWQFFFSCFSFTAKLFSPPCCALGKIDNMRHTWQNLDSAGRWPGLYMRWQLSDQVQSYIIVTEDFLLFSPFTK